MKIQLDDNESVATSLSEYQKLQGDILYRNGEYHSSHNMFIDLDDMWRGCLRCKTGDQTTKGFETLKQPCKGEPPLTEGRIRTRQKDYDKPTSPTANLKPISPPPSPTKDTDK